LERRKFNYYLTTGIFSILFFNYLSNIHNNDLKNYIGSEKRKLIREYNKLREKNLKNNLIYEVKNDYLNNKTIWIGRKLYTYAELSRI
tara:strand:+ start:190 stop:453 length:264 start_codon:yes stop_codon:yes gene_type:complete